MKRRTGRGRDDYKEQGACSTIGLGVIEAYLMVLIRGTPIRHVCEGAVGFRARDKLKRRLR